MQEATLPIPTPQQTATGCRIYNRLGLVMSSYRSWFGEGVPHEWIRALDAIQQTLTACKREAKLADEEQPHA